MFKHAEPGSDGEPTRRIDPIHKVLFAFGLFAPAMTFALAVSEMSIGRKTLVLAGLAAVYVGIGAWVLFGSRKNADEVQDEAEMPAVESEPTASDRLLALEEANVFFGSSLKSADMFRLVSSRVNEIFPFAAAVLFVPDADATELAASHAVGMNARMLEEARGELSAGLAGLALLSCEIEMDADLSAEIETRSPEQLNGFASSAAIPLIHEGRSFAVFQIYTEDRITADEKTRELLDAIGQRISPLFLSSRTFEQTITNALTDPLTNLPNERALFMILENQLAESQRFRDERPLSVLAIDLKGFDETNRQYGHATGDNILRHAGETIRDGLRKMDFLARAYNDEFIVVLPTATEKMTADVIERLKEIFNDSPFEITEHEQVKLWLNIGWATFWKDGESAQQLLRAARLRKQQAKSTQSSNVAWFGKEYVN